ncbi:hypothetical protein CAI16_14625 [Virgibacillus dokdonensis]|uniref:Sirohydrochlorin ferrochelatase n=1 Tax=Virgibacillus dokdonensis TaxID=302167 RepID=A0A3E0WKL8_9BACI|nr:CbiX/SirB N-terminal domain-containing protein [Virgibacillus dokdonensis]RFA33500.1 hypothetical protein CAI16_14625 [Virgibacillus dokdonensis]
MDKDVVVIVYHGSKDDDKNQAFLNFVDHLNLQAWDDGNARFIGCYIEQAEPTINQIMQQRDSLYGRVYIFSLLFLRGKHYNKDVKGVIEAYEQEINKNTVLLPPLCEDDLFLTYVVERLYSVYNQPVIIAAHGSAHDTRANDALEQLTTLLEQQYSRPSSSLFLFGEGQHAVLEQFSFRYELFYILPLTFGKGAVYEQFKDRVLGYPKAKLLPPVYFDKSLQNYVLLKLKSLREDVEK